jgi:hypothetical protein
MSRAHHPPLARLTRRAVAGLACLTGLFVVSAAFGGSLLGSGPPVSGASARFSVSISGTFTSSGQLAHPCHDANDNPIVAQRVAKTAWTFASTKAGRAEFQYLTPNLGAGMTKLITVAATGTRSASESPVCAQDTSNAPIGSGCGTKHGRYFMSVYATGERPARIGYAMQKDISHIDLADDPWDPESCPALAQVWTKLTVYSAPPTPISLAKIFDKGARRVVAHGKRTGHATDTAATDAASSSSWTLRYTVTLTRLR